MLRRILAVVTLITGLLAASVTGLSGTTPASAFSAAGPGPYPLGPGYWMASSDGGIFALGQARFLGSVGGTVLQQPVVGMAAHPFFEGYWLVAADGGIFSFGSSGFFGSMGGQPLNEPIVAMAATPTGLGYWLVATDGGIFSFGDAQFHGSTGDMTINEPIVAMAATPSGGGYWLVASDGGIFAFGDAQFHGSMGHTPLNRPVVGMTNTRGGDGYYLVATDGGIFAFGDAGYHGSMGGRPLNRPVVGMTTDRAGTGYHLVATDGGVFSFNAPFLGSLGNLQLREPVLGIANRPPLAVTADPFAKTASEWTEVAGDSRLRLPNGASPNPPAGARIYGLEGLETNQVSYVGFTLEGGTCASHGDPHFVVYYDSNNDGAGDASQTLTCGTGGAGTSKTWDLSNAGVPDNVMITAVDIMQTTPNATAVLDDILISVPDTPPDPLTIRGPGTVRATA